MIFFLKYTLHHMKEGHFESNIITCNKEVFKVLSLASGYFEGTIFDQIAVILVTNTPRSIPGFPLCRPFLHEITFLYPYRNHRMYEGIIIFILLYSKMASPDIFCNYRNDVQKLFIYCDAFDSNVRR